MDLKIGLLTLYAVVTTALLAYNRFFKDRGSVIFSFPNERSRDVFLEVMRHFGREPSKRADTRIAKRAIFPDGFIANIPRTDIFDGDGLPQASIAFVSSQPLGEAVAIEHLLKQKGYTALAIPNPDSDVPRGQLAFIRTNAFPQLIVVRNNMFRMPRPMPWGESSAIE